MVFVRDKQIMTCLRASLQRPDERINHHFADRIRRTQLPRDRPHRPVAVAAPGRLDDGEVKGNGSNSQQIRESAVQKDASYRRVLHGVTVILTDSMTARLLFQA